MRRNALGDLTAYYALTHNGQMKCRLAFVEAVGPAVVSKYREGVKPCFRVVVAVTTTRSG